MRSSSAESLRWAAVAVTAAAGVPWAAVYGALGLLGWLLLAASPLWLPPVVVILRNRIFAAINGEEGVLFPNETVRGEAFKRLYNDPAADLRSKQRTPGLSDVFWYFLHPASYIHQEHLEGDTLAYREAARATRLLLARREPTDLDALARRVTRDFVARRAIHRVRPVRLREFYFELMSALFHELVFDSEASPDVLELETQSGLDVITALKFLKLRDMPLRKRLLSYLEERVANGDVAYAFQSDCLTQREKALHLQGVFFHTGSVQLSEALAHLTICIAQHKSVARRVEQDEEGYLDRVITEQLRLFPLFGVAHRIASDNIEGVADTTIAQGTVMLFNYLDFQTDGYDRPHDFDPDRWLTLQKRNCNYIPFGVAKNRPCPAMKLSLQCMATMMAELLKHYDFESPTHHTRSLPDGGVCLVINRGWLTRNRAAPALVLLTETATILYDAVMAVPRSVAQLILGTWMLLDARRQQMAFRYFSGAAE